MQADELLALLDALRSRGIEPSAVQIGQTRVELRAWPPADQATELPRVQEEPEPIWFRAPGGPRPEQVPDEGDS